MTSAVRIAFFIGASLLASQQAAAARANPIRKVVNMLQMMQKKVTQEGEDEKALFEKFECYCKGSGGDLAKSIEDAKTKIPQLESGIESAGGQKAQFDKDIEDHKADRKAAKTAIAEATGIRNKEKATFDKESSDAKVNLDAMNKAIAALEAGMGGGFLQTGAAQHLRAMLSSGRDELDDDKQELLSFLSNKDEKYAPQGGEIVGILKQMNDESTADLKDMVAAEAGAVKQYDELVAAKKKEIAALSKMLEEKLQRVGELAVEIETMKNDLDDTKKALAEDEKFLAGLDTMCANKAKEWDERQKVRSQELLALADTIKVLNDDDALDLFKKTLPSASASFLQIQVDGATMKSQALDIVKEARRRPGASRHQLDFIALALRGKQAGFDKVIALIDGLTQSLKKEQKDDDDKKVYCEAEFDASDDKKKGLERNIKDLETVIAEAKESIADLDEEIKTTEAGIKALDKSVAEATAQRKAEHKEYEGATASNAAAKEVILFAKNRLSKFYAPELYKAPPKREMSEEDRITVNMGGTLAPTQAPGGIAGTGIALVQAAPGAPPATPGGEYKKSEESGGVMEMMNILVADLDKEMTVAKAEEKDAQADYEKMMEDSASKREVDAKSVADQKGAKAELESSLTDHKAEKASTAQELATTLEYIHSLHSDCDWLLKYFDTRKAARANEADSLEKAKAVLSGADYSFVQTGLTRSALRGRGSSLSVDAA